MASLVKTKVGISVFSLIAIVIISGVYTQGNNPNYRRYIKWHPDSTLEKSDFRMKAPFFTEYDAGLYTFIDFTGINEYGAEVAAFVDKNQSFCKDEEDSPKLLRHEKYHANLTYHAAQKINSILNEQYENQSQAEHIRDSIWHELITLQALYDKETAHSQNKPMQSYWEYKIDSMNNKIDVIDHFSGATAYFTDQPQLSYIVDTFDLRKVYELNKYDMRFRIITEYDHNENTAKIETNFVNYLNKYFIDIESTVSTWNNKYLLETQCKDTVNNRTFCDRVIQDNNRSYHLTFFCPTDRFKLETYQKIKTLFFDSFELKNQEDYWIDYWESNDFYELIDISDRDKTEIGHFTRLNRSDWTLTYYPPFVYEDKLLIPFDQIKHDLDSIQDLVVLFNDGDKAFIQKSQMEPHIIGIDTIHLINDTTKIQFGYTLKQKDTLNPEYHLFGTIVEFAKK